MSPALQELINLMLDQPKKQKQKNKPNPLAMREWLKKLKKKPS